MRQTDPVKARIEALNEPLPVETEAGRALRGKPHEDSGPIVAENGARERVKPGYDTFTVSDFEHEQMGRRDGEVARWLIDPRADGINNASDPEVRAQMVGGRIPTDKNGRPKRYMDCVLAYIPAEVAERYAADEQAQLDEFIAEQSADAPEESRESLEARKRETRERVVREGLMGRNSTTSGYSPDQFLKQIGGPEKLEEFEAQFRTAGRFTAPVVLVPSQASGGGQSRSTGKRSYSLPGRPTQ